MITTRPRPNSADLAVLATPALANTIIGSSVTLTVVATNGGPADATGVVLTNLLPTGFYLASVQLSRGDYVRTGNILTVNVGALTKGDFVSLTLDGSLTYGGRFTNVAGVYGVEADSNPLNNVGSQVLVVPAPSLSIGRMNTNLVVMWPNLSTYQLQVSPYLGAAAVWRLSTLPYQIFDSQNMAIFGVPQGSNLFFRLVKP